MYQTIIITDLTQMPNPKGVCIVGINRQGKNIRPVLQPPGVLREHLYVDGKLVILPRAKVKFNFYQVPVEAPHIEDLGFNLDSIVYDGSCNDSEWEKVLQFGSFSTVSAIYDGLLQTNRWVKPGARTRSIGTLSQAYITAVQLSEWSGKLKYRLSFRDQGGYLYKDIPVSDLAFREFSYAEVKKHNRQPSVVSQEITNSLKAVDRLYLRLGLARQWQNPNTGDTGCWVQVTGIHTFPDYLKGKSFAEF